MEQYIIQYKEFFIKIGLCILCVVVGLLINKASSFFIKKWFKSKTAEAQRKTNTFSAVLSSGLRYFIYFCVFCAIMNIFDVDISSIITFAGFGSVALAFGAQSLVQDVITGLFILFEDQFGVGDVISIEGHTGTVESIGVRSTRIRSVDGNLYIVPNGQVKIVTNMSKGFNRAVVDIGIAYEADVDNAIKVMEDELKNAFDKNIIKGLKACPVVLGVVELGDSAVVIRISADSHIGENWQIEREIRRIIKNRLDKENICIPYPQRVVHIAGKEEN